MEWQSITDFASKAAENVVRLAALFYLFDGTTGDISAEHIERATEIIRWHLFASKSILGHNPQTACQLDAKKLIQWITEKELYEVSPRYLLQYGPLRDKKRHDTAIELLVNTHYTREIKQHGKTLLHVNPAIFNS